MVAVTKEQDYLDILRAVRDLPFPMGGKLLTSVLVGDATHETVARYRLDREQAFGSLGGYDEQEIEQLLQSCVAHGLLERTALPGKSFAKVHRLTEKGKQELRKPVGLRPTSALNPTFIPTPITDQERQLIASFGFLLKQYTPEQQHAIVAQAPRILCVAGAGSGKTTVLTKRVEFLVRCCGVAPERILAITFTRKARAEMEHRLNGLVRIETFNSFGERLLQQHGDHLYGRPVRILQYADRMRLLYHALKRLDLDLGYVIERHFTARQRRDKTREQLARLLAHDCFGIVDYYANQGLELQPFATTPDAKIIEDLCRCVREEMRASGLRDYSDQLLDTIRLFKENPRLVPRYDHILVDEYQDVNPVQKTLLDLLAPSHLFVVGDPRQSIFGWRGSRVRCILEFPTEQPTTVVALTSNHRSAADIVAAMNAAIQPMRMPDLVATRTEPGIARLRQFADDDAERAWIAAQIASSSTPRAEIFALARTNRALQDLSDTLTARDIAHLVRSDEEGRLPAPQAGMVVLSTVHAIKGLEAETVFVVGANAQSYPCMAGDHPVMDMVRTVEHDRDEEELRLFYVALSRAKRELFVTYSGTPSRFLTPELRRLLGEAQRTLASKPPTTKTQGAGGKLYERLREWRARTSRKAGVPAYLVFPDATLLAIAQQQPTSMDDLHMVKGIGPAKAHKYGAEIIELVTG